MLIIRPLACPICQGAVAAAAVQCPRCQCVVQFTIQPPTFARSNLVETLVQPVLGASRARVATTPQDGLAQYILGLCYLNYELLDQGLMALQQAAVLLPERHRIRFEVAILQSVTGQFPLALEQITLAQNMVPNDADYQYLTFYLRGMAAQAGHEVRSAVTSLGSAYQLAPHGALAAAALTQFIDAHAAKLSQPIARTLPGLAPSDTENLRVLTSDPALQKEAHPKAPHKPGTLGSVSLGLLRKVSPARATAVEQIHHERMNAYQQAAEAYALAYQASAGQRSEAIRTWQVRAQAIRSDLPAMARLCLAVVEEEARREQEEARRREEEARRQAENERRRQANEQRRLADQQQKALAQSQANEQHRLADQQQKALAQSSAPLPVAARPQKPVREKQYLSTNAHYIQGLPQGKEKDVVTLTASNVSITIKHGGMLGAWEVRFPTTALAEATVEIVKHMLSSEKRLRLSYLDDRGLLKHATFAQLNAEDAVRKIMQARTGN